jgi:diaminohydroxyphosphoribosylaminopyrimidine deaminase/5-amino-6-(5-phosphoribosylamino)uracil reductase
MLDAAARDERRMRTALALAHRGLGKTSPNPMVGAVIVRDDVVIGRGYHRRYGGPHAEVNAIRDAGGDISGATLYVTLEPCCHRGKKTPPCLDMLLEHGLRRVVIGTPDPNPQVNGRSIQVLRERGIETQVGVLAGECERLNEVYFKFVRTGRPFVTLKWAQTIDGRIAAANGDSRWISSEPSLRYAHRLRSCHDAVLVGIGTVMSDNPRLTVRLVKGRSPVRIVADSRLRVPLSAAVLQEQDVARTIVVSTSLAADEKLSAMRRMGVQTLTAERDEEGRIDLSDLLATLGKMSISSVLVEGGAALATSFLSRGLADKLVVILAPKIMGEGIQAVGDVHVMSVADAPQLSLDRTYRSGDDLIIEARPLAGA